MLGKVAGIAVEDRDFVESAQIHPLTGYEILPDPGSRCDRQAEDSFFFRGVLLNILQPLTMFVNVSNFGISRFSWKSIDQSENGEEGEGPAEGTLKLGALNSIPGKLVDPS